VSIDPSSIPSFGPRQPAPVIAPDADLVAQLLTQMQLEPARDAHGGVAVQREDLRIHYLFQGERRELFTVRASYARRYPVTRLGEILALADQWSRTTLWPKLYGHPHDKEFHLVGDCHMIVGTGVNPDHFLASTAAWTSAAIEFAQWIGQRDATAPAAPEVGAQGPETAS
jgi:hypothetical protein